MVSYTCRTLRHGSAASAKQRNSTGRSGPSGGVRTRILAVRSGESVCGVRHTDRPCVGHDGTPQATRQVELIELLEKIDREVPAEKTRIHVVLDNVSTHHGKLARQWLSGHERFRFSFPPMHCSWLNRLHKRKGVEQWFSILRRKRLRIVDFRDLAHLQQSLQQFIAEWNEIAHPFQWTTKSFVKIMARCENSQNPCLEVAA
ncbi:hypothetical protein GC176_21290 [bacterium]|nr:hypothetical protein [bacterium]